MLVIPDNWYTYGIPIQISPWVIQKVMWMVTAQNFNELMEVWRNMYISTVTVGQLALSKTAKSVFNLSTVRGPIITSKKVILSTFQMQTMSDVSRVMGHVKQVHVIAEPREQGFSNELVTTSIYSDLKPGSNRLKICLQNLTSKKIVIPSWCVIGQIQATDEVPAMYAPVTPKGCLIMGLPPKIENWLSPVPTPDCRDDLSWSPAGAEQKAPLLIEPHLNRSTCWGAHHGLWKIVRWLWICYICYWNLQMFSPNMI